MTSADLLKFDTEVLSSSSSALIEAHAAIGRELAGLTSMAARIRGQWTGEANEAFTAAQAKWSTEFERMARILETTARALDAAAQQYSQTEKANGQRWPG